MHRDRPAVPEQPGSASGALPATDRDVALGALFDQIAELYDKVRPTYPEALFDELIKQTGLTDGSQLLEIAPGTGQATLSLAQRGFRIVGVELGTRLSQIAKKNLVQFRNVEIINEPFEDVNLPANHFDLIYVATAFHWIRPNARFSKPYALLKNDGLLAIINGDHIASAAGNDLFDATQPIYRKYWPNHQGHSRLSAIAQINPTTFDDNIFEFVQSKCFPQTTTYTAKAYCELLNTESEKLALPAEQRRRFLEEIERLINDRFNGMAERRHANSLLILRKRSPA